jgi:hypothetical protein
MDWLETRGDAQIRPSPEQDLKILSLLDVATDRIIAQDAEIAELRMSSSGVVDGGSRP